jgi:hypothetical protein
MAASRNEHLAKTLGAHGVSAADMSPAPETKLDCKEKTTGQSSSTNDTGESAGVGPVALIVIGAVVLVAAIGVGYYIGQRRESGCT